MFHVKFDLELKNKYRKNYIIGVDEAGRGPLAGPVVACASLIKNYNNPILNKIKDSKKLSSSKREEIFKNLVNNKEFIFSIGYSTNEEIDKYNILNATLIAMKRAIERLLRFMNLNTQDMLIVVDGNKIINDLDLDQICIVKGDMKSAVIGCSSIFAKVLRDRWMDYYDKIYPVYSFKKHKGYPTKTHVEAVEKFGYSPIHRRSFKICRSLSYE